MRPFIGVTCSSDPSGNPRVNPRYVRALHESGALPVPLPFIETIGQAHELIERLSGMLFTGSEDPDPSLWGEERHPATKVMHPARLRTELLLGRAVFERRTPTLAICGGMQNINVAAGGSLHQHVPDLSAEIVHSDPTFESRHDVLAETGSRLAALCGPRFAVNTEHHQAVNRLADGLVATASAPDGIVEAWEAEDAPFLVGVQWHPELMLDDAGQARLFVELVHAAGAGLHATQGA
ncbi:MAG: gamma-glutamyl-gamma-aminobutyrate hydrolase family protein [Planctomycetota bacterium]|jgi:putative glutamine amidotransferase